jgi:hypothetical protein
MLLSAPVTLGGYGRRVEGPWEFVDSWGPSLRLGEGELDRVSEMGFRAAVQAPDCSKRRLIVRYEATVHITAINIRLRSGGGFRSDPSDSLES